MAYCVDCGQEIPEGAGACPQCGRPLQPAVLSRPVKTSGLAIASLVLSILGLFTMGLGSLVGMILGVVALIKIRNSNGEVGGTGLAAAGLALGAVIMFFGLILAAIAIPNFIMMQKKAKTSEAKTNLGAIFTAQVAYFGERNEYGKTFSDIGWRPEGQTTYSYHLCNDVIESTRVKVDLPKGIEAKCETDGFFAIAVGNIDGDTFLDVWTVNEMKELRQAQDDVRNY